MKMLVLSLAVLIASGPAWASSTRKAAGRAPVARTNLASRELRRRPLTINDANVDKLPQLHVGKGTATVVTFPSDITDGGVLVGAADDLFYPTAQTSRMFVLSPKNDLVAPVPVNVTLKDGTIVTFQALSSKTDVDVQVDVDLQLSRRASQDSPVVLRATIGSLRTQLDECRATSGDAGAQKLASLLITQNLDSPMAFDRRPLHMIEKQHRLLVEAKWAYRLLGLTYVVLNVENRDPSKSWVLDRAEATVVGGREKEDVKVSAVASEFQTLVPDQGGRIVISFPTPTTGASQRIALSLYERDGGRFITLPAMDL